MPAQVAVEWAGQDKRRYERVRRTGLVLFLQSRGDSVLTNVLHDNRLGHERRERDGIAHELAPAFEARAVDDGRGHSRHWFVELHVGLRGINVAHARAV